METAKKMHEIIDEYLQFEFGDGWTFTPKRVKKDGEYYLNLECQLRVPKLDDGGQIEDYDVVSVYFPCWIKDGSPEDEWVDDFRQLVEKISTTFSGDYIDILLALDDLAREGKIRQNKSREDFAEDLQDINFNTLPRFVDRISWDDWERLMMEYRHVN